MLATEHRRSNERQIGGRAKSARRTSAFTKPKASARKLHHPDVAKSKSKTPEQKSSRGLESPISNGASPVASALGIRLGGTPRGPHQPNMLSPAPPSKQDISTLLGIGHFYFALTGGGGIPSRFAGRLDPVAPVGIQDPSSVKCRMEENGYATSGSLPGCRQSLEDWSGGALSGNIRVH